MKVHAEPPTPAEPAAHVPSPRGPAPTAKPDDGAGDSAYRALVERATDPAAVGATAGEARERRDVLARMERAFGTSLADVELRTDEHAAARAAALGVLAYTDGQEIGFAAGRWSPQTRDGQRTIAHEVAHVVQARGGAGGPAVRGRAPGPGAGDPIEAAADAAATAVERGEAPRVAPAAWSGVRGQTPPAATSPAPPPPADSFKLAEDEQGNFEFTVRGSVYKAWGTDALRQAFKAYVLRAFPGVTDAIAEACANDAKLQWVLEPSAKVLDDDEIKLSIESDAQAYAGEWMHDHYPAIKQVRPRSGTYKLPPKHAKREGGGTGEGEPIRQFDPEGELVFQPELIPFVAGASIHVSFRFTNQDDEGRLYNFYPFTRRVDYDWTISKAGKVVDRGPLIESGGDNEYTFDVAEAGAYEVSVTAKSRYFVGGKTLTRTRGFEVVKEQTRRETAIKAGFIGPEADKPFDFDATGQLVVKAGAKSSGAAIDDELSRLNFELGAIQAAKDSIPADKLTEYVTYYEGRIQALKDVQTKVAKHDYVVGGVFVSREDGRTYPLRAAMGGRRLGVDSGQARYAAAVHDVTLSSDPIQHAGTGSAPALPDEAAGYVAAEDKAIDAIASDWHWFNDYPDGSIQLVVGLREAGGGKTKTVVIDTANIKKPARTVLTGVALVGSVALVALSGGTAAPLLVITLEVATTAAAVALTTDSILTRLNNGTFKMDSKLVLDMLSLVPIAGSLARMGGVITGRGLLLLNLVVAGGTGVLIAEETRSAIRDAEARYAGKIAAATTPEEKARLETERKQLIARILGGAAVSGGLILVMAAVGAKKGLSEPRPTGEVLPPKGTAAEPGAPVGAPPGGPVKTPGQPVPPAKTPVEPPAAQPPAKTPEPPAAPPPAKTPEPPTAPPPAKAPEPPAAPPPAKTPVEPPAPGKAPGEPTPPAATTAPPTTTAPPPQPPVLTPVTRTGPNWGIPEGGVPIQTRAAQKGVTIPSYAKKDPGSYYYNPKTGKYPRRIGFPMDEGAGHQIPCFPAGTLVATPDGPRGIDRILAGEEVLAYQEQRHAVVARRVLEQHVSSAEWLYRIATSRAVVLATGDHLFWVGAGEYRAARDLGPGVALLSSDGTRREVRAVDLVHTGPQPTYNLTVAGDFTYFVGPEGLLVHNDGPFCIYIGRDSVTNEVVYVGQTDQTLQARQAEHRREAVLEPEKYAGKKNVVLEFARGPDGKLLTDLSHDEAHFWERKIYDREAAGGAKLVNRQLPYTDESMTELITKHCPK